MALISVIVPIYNAGEYLLPCLESIAAQTHRQLEVLLVENASTDSSRRTCADFCARDPRFRLLPQSQNLGAAGARALGAAQAQGSCLAFVDGDDLLHPCFLEALVRALEGSGQPISCCRYAPFAADTLPSSGPVPEDWQILAAPEHLRALLQDQRVDYSLCNKLYRAGALTPQDLQSDVATNEDLLANWRCMRRAGGLAFVDLVGYHYRQHPASASHRPLCSGFLTNQLQVAQTILDQSAGTDLAPVAQAFYYEKLLYLYSMILRQSNADAFSGLRRQLLGSIRSQLTAALRCPALSARMKGIALLSAFGGPVYAALCRRLLTDRQG